MRDLVEAGEPPSALTPARLAAAAEAAIGRPVEIDEATLRDALDPAACAEARRQTGSSSAGRDGGDARRASTRPSPSMSAGARQHGSGSRPPRRRCSRAPASSPDRDRAGSSLPIEKTKGDETASFSHRADRAAHRALDRYRVCGAADRPPGQAVAGAGGRGAGERARRRVRQGCRRMGRCARRARRCQEAARRKCRRACARQAPEPHRQSARGAPTGRAVRGGAARRRPAARRREEPLGADRRRAVLARRRRVR